jgi:hypothetical protein
MYTPDASKRIKLYCTIFASNFFSFCVFLNLIYTRIVDLHMVVDAENNNYWFLLKTQEKEKTVYVVLHLSLLSMCGKANNNVYVPFFTLLTAETKQQNRFFSSQRVCQLASKKKKLFYLILYVKKKILHNYMNCLCVIIN